jgi:hypothetical protein
MTISLNNAIGDFFGTKEKWMTLLLLSVCQFIPIVGPMVMMGYFTRRFALVRSGGEEIDFTFDGFSEYLNIGLWPTLAYLVVSFVAIPLIFIAEVPMLFAIMKMAEDPESIVPLIGGMAVTYAMIFAISILLILVASPIILRSSLMKSFKEGFSMSFIVSFLKKVGLSFTLWIVVLAILTFFASILGMLAFFVGSIFVGTVAMYAGFHMLYQHYELYLERGGEKIEIHPDILKKATVVPPLPPSGDPPLLKGDGE